MNILILGGGGREHSLAWAVAQNPKCDRLMVAPGNAGIAKIADCVTLDILDGAAVLAFVRSQAIDFVIIGPEAPLAAGVADVLRAADVLCFGPSQSGSAAGSLKILYKIHLRRRRCAHCRICPFYRPAKRVRLCAQNGSTDCGQS